MYQPNTILSLSAENARKFFLRKESFCSIDLPVYFDFQPLLYSLYGVIDKYELRRNSDQKYKVYSNRDNQFIDLKPCPNQLENLNHKFFQNKDGRYSWRPLQIINPAIYVFLVLEITKEENWTVIQKRFKEFASYGENCSMVKTPSRINCFSIPLIPEETKKDKAAAITNWWQQIEQQSMELALEYPCFANTDITDCYGSTYTHSIPWALHGKEEIKGNRIRPKKEKLDYIGDRIDTIIQTMSYGQTNGIPQGSVLMDFIAEMVLGYVDLKLAEAIDTNSREIKEYKILRYRDDYRIFAKTQEDAVIILKLLSEVLMDLNLKLNTQKTFISNNIISDSIKSDKLYWNTAKHSERTLQQHLLLIHDLAHKHPNSGSVRKALDKFYRRIYPLQLFKEDNSRVLVSILVDIAYNNPAAWPIVVSILSKILSLETSKDSVLEMVEKIREKFADVPNVGHLDVWMQRLTYKWDAEIKYDEPLCGVVLGESNDAIWNVSWLKEDLQRVIKETSIIDKKRLEEMDVVIRPVEVEVFNNKYM